MSKGGVKRKIAVDPKEAEVVRLIYRWYLADMGAKTIAERLNREGHSYRGRQWSKNRILDIIGEEAYVGRYYYNRTDHRTHKLKPQEEWILIPVEPIVDEGTWERAKALKAERAPSEAKGNPAVAGSKTLLTGLAFCGLCGARMGLETGKGGKFTYYNCSNYLRKGKSICRGQRIPAHELESAIISHMADKLFTTDRVKEVLKGIFAEMRNRDKEVEGQRKSVTRQLELIKAKLTKQYEAIESGAIDLNDVAERIKELKSQRSLLENRLAEMKSHRVIPFHLFKDESIREFQSSIRELFMGLGADRILTKSYLKLFIEKMVVNLPRIDITCKSDVLLTALENTSAVRTGEILTAELYWLPSADSNHGPDG